MHGRERAVERQPAIRTVFDRVQAWLIAHDFNGVDSGGSAVERRPADVVSAPLVVENELANRLGQLIALPPALHLADALGLAPRGGRAAELAAPPTARVSIILTSPRTQARACSIARRGRTSDGATASNSGSTCSAQVAAHKASSRWSASVRVPPRRIVMKRVSRTVGRITRYVLV